MKMVSSKQQNQHPDHHDESGTVNNAGSSPQFVYDVTGDSAAAMRVLVDNSTKERASRYGTTVSGTNDRGSATRFVQTPQEEYNALILTTLAKADAKDSNLFQPLVSVKDALSIDSSSSTARKRKREEWILLYNQGLILLASGQVQESVNVLWEKLQPLVVPSETHDKLSKKAVYGDILKIACRVGFLLIECILTLWPMRPIAQDNATPTHPDLDVLHTWLGEQVERRLPSEDAQLKFLLSLYRSRIDFFERGAQGRIVDSNIRSARKELKLAMEIFQHKLRASNDSGSLASSSYSEQDNTSRGGAKSPTPLSMMSGNPNSSNNSNNIGMSRILLAQNQAALNLKANTEQLKGNIKKALILCAEAQGLQESMNADDQQPQQENFKNSVPSYYDAIHQNNLAIVYETSGKSHVALHALSKAVRLSCNFDGSGDNPLGRMFDSDGTARPNLTLPILHNAAICSLKASNYLSAYECMAICIRASSVWRSRPRSWLRLAEACIGLETKRKKECKEARFCKVEMDGQAKGVLLDSNTSSVWYHDSSKPLPALASPEDMEEVKNYPLARARCALEKALELHSDVSNDLKANDYVGLQSTRLAYAYVCLEGKDFRQALHYAESILKSNPEPMDEERKEPDDLIADSARRTMLKRQLATARMYAAEASAALGEAMASMKHLVGDGKDDAFDRLASELGGVTLEMAAVNPKAKARLAKAQTMVRCSASAASASLGNLAASKQLAMSAQAMEGSYSATREGSSARKALIYCMLRDGNQAAALTLLRSAR